MKWQVAGPVKYSANLAIQFRDALFLDPSNQGTQSRILPPGDMRPVPDKFLPLMDWATYSALVRIGRSPYWFGPEISDGMKRAVQWGLAAAKKTRAPDDFVFACTHAGVRYMRFYESLPWVVSPHVPPYPRKNEQARPDSLDGLVIPWVFGHG